MKPSDMSFIKCLLCLTISNTSTTPIIAGLWAIGAALWLASTFTDLYIEWRYK